MYGIDGSDKRCVRQIIYDYLTDRTATRISSIDSTDNKIIFSDWHRIDGLDKEPIILKETGFNLPKTNIASNDENRLFTAKGAFDMVVEFDTKLEKKLDVSVKDRFKGFTNGVNGLYLSQGNTLNFVSNNGTYHFNYFTIGDKPITEFQIRGGSSDSWGNLRLGNVYPTNISSSINNESRTDIANSYAVKTAYDKAIEALNPVETVLWSGRFASSDSYGKSYIDLAQSYKKFKYLIAITSNDNENLFQQSIVKVSLIEPNKNLNLGSYYDWYAKFTSDTRLTLVDENCILHKVIGLNTL